MDDVRQVNVIGHLGAQSGLGNTARAFVRALQRHGYKVSGLDIDGRSPTARAVEGVDAVESVDRLPSGVNLLVLSLDRSARLLLRQLPGLMDPRFVNIGMVFWELALIPPAWKTTLRLFDALAVCSRYCQQTYETACPEVPVVYCEHPLETPLELGPQARLQARRERGIGDDRFLVVSSFDARSDTGRKNPFAAIETFKRAFPTGEPAALIVKVNGHGGADRDALGAAIRDDARIRLLTETLPYDEVRGLYASADVYLTLHRSEGLGLGGMEAMAEGTLVIATAHSGNLSYMTEQNSLLVPYTLVPPRDTIWFFDPAFAGDGARWADADLDAAAAMLVGAYRDRALRTRLATQAREDILRRQATAWDVVALRSLIERLSRSRIDAASRSRHRRRAQLALVAHPRLLGRNVRAALWRARNLSTARRARPSA